MKIWRKRPKNELFSSELKLTEQNLMPSVKPSKLFTHTKRY